MSKQMKELQGAGHVSMLDDIPASGRLPARALLARQVLAVFLLSLQHPSTKSVPSDSMFRFNIYATL